MKIQQNRFVKANGINALIVFFSGVVVASNSPTISSTFAPSPIGFLTIGLAQQPAPLSLSIHPFPIQQARANLDFKIHLKPFFSVSHPEISYRLTNRFWNKDSSTAGIIGTRVGIVGLPYGINQIANRPDDCALTQFQLTSLQSCLLHFDVDPDTYPIGAVAYGPGVTIQVCWKWGVHYKHGACQDIYVLPMESQRVGPLLAPIMLPTIMKVTPTEQDGLRFSPDKLEITGKPIRTGPYVFSVSATNGNVTTASRELQIEVGVDLKDKPVFKNYFSVASAMPEQKYQLHLMALLEPTAGFTVNNQINFRIDTRQPHPKWLHINEHDATLLQGRVPPSDAGQQLKVTLIASSNTGGDSLPLTIEIPVAFDPAKKPNIAKGIELTGAAGNGLHGDLRQYISDPTADDNLKVIIDKVEPKAAWLSVSSWNLMELTGLVPENAVGQEYIITLHANTAIGGNSDPITIPLKIKIDSKQTPRFHLDNPQLPLAYVGQPYFHDFVANRDVYPAYSDIPYIIELAEGYNNPAWVRIEGNKLLVDSVPDKLGSTQTIFITIKNIPGGRSKILPLKLTIMN